MVKSNSNQWPKISIITPSFNQGKFIKETIESVLNQNYPNLEYWIIDGGSTDNTVKILKSYKNKIKWVSEKDKGQTDALNKGLKKVSGEIIAYLNSDDAYLPNTFYAVVDLFQKNPKAMWLTGDYFIIDEHGKKMQPFVAEYKRWWRKSPSFSSLAIANFIVQPSTFWRKKVIKEIGLFNVQWRYCMDYDYWLRIIKKYPLLVSNHHFSLFRIHNQSKGGSQFDKQFKEEHTVLTQQSQNSLLLMLHWFHAQAIVLAYRLLKR
jgi:glycosyltransferase involved in cell wall biosynthesis